MKKILFLLLLLFIFPLSVFSYDFNINSNNVILINLNEDKILYEKNSDSKTYIASLTKIMTAVVTLENINDLSTKVLLTTEDFKDIYKYDLQTSGLRVNNSYSYEELLYALLISSGADAASCLARNIGGSVSNFVKMMNDKAKELNLNNTKFANPIGYDDVNNYSTVKEISILFKYALNNETFKKIITTFSYKTHDNITLKHTLNYYANKYNLTLDNISGGKTGNETLSGYCLASISLKDINYMLVTTNSKISSGQLKDALNLYKYYRDNYNYQTIIKSKEIIYYLKTKYFKEDKIPIYSKRKYSYYLENNYNKDDIKIEYNFLDNISYKNKINSKIGSIKIYYKDTLLNAASSATSVTSLCNCNTDAGTCGVIGPKNASRTISALPSPFATIKIFFACIMVLMPIVYACFGTSSAEAKNLLFASMVDWVKFTQCTSLSKDSDGSLKPICPLWPIPRSCKSTPPIDWINFV